MQTRNNQLEGKSAQNTDCLWIKEREYSTETWELSGRSTISAETMTVEFDEAEWWNIRTNCWMNWNWRAITDT